jgi:REP element-mobilizing transposase RayT
MGNKKNLQALKGRNQYYMGQSLVKNYLHLIFSTKLRAPVIHPPYNLELYSYLGGICNNLDSQVVRIGGYSDHVHILCMLSKKLPSRNL